MLGAGDGEKPFPGVDAAERWRVDMPAAVNQMTVERGCPAREVALLPGLQPPPDVREHMIPIRKAKEDRHKWFPPNLVHVVRTWQTRGHS